VLKFPVASVLGSVALVGIIAVGLWPNTAAVSRSTTFQSELRRHDEHLGSTPSPQAGADRAGAELDARGLYESHQLKDSFANIAK
jgi:hypothetical protein